MEIESSSAKALQQLQRTDQIRIANAITALAADPRPHGCTKLVGTDDSYRIWIGVFRIVYTIDDTIRIVTITRIGHRKDIYR
ncbi:MAG: type II toxin-antitoxin system RelE/ParE family toxin [Mycobacteriaceae bacterium]|nr:type II toxin-antitoxin system RelE/ParE family toxin [Mycobacteriaceae bacterium]